MCEHHPVRSGGYLSNKNNMDRPLDVYYKDLTVNQVDYIGSYYTSGGNTLYYTDGAWSTGSPTIAQVQNATYNGFANQGKLTGKVLELFYVLKMWRICSLRKPFNTHGLKETKKVFKKISHARH